MIIDIRLIIDYLDRLIIYIFFIFLFSLYKKTKYKRPYFHKYEIIIVSRSRFFGRLNIIDDERARTICARPSALSNLTTALQEIARQTNASEPRLILRGHSHVKN